MTYQKSTARARLLAALAATLFSTATLADGSGSPALTKSLGEGTNWVLDKTTQLASLSIAKGAGITTSKDHSVTLTVDGVETGIVPGHYQGNIQLTVTDANPVVFALLGGAGSLTHPFREALFLDQNGIVAGKSVLAAAGSYALNKGVLSGAKVISVGENFNGIYVTGGHYTIRGATVDLTGNGGNDFAGFGAGIMSTGKDTTLVIDGAKIRTHGAVRTGVVADKGSHLIVKNSDIVARTGVLPADYISNVTPGQMKDVPWMLGLSGNVRATNLLGDDTVATYINSTVSAEGWGVLSIDSSQNTKLTAINSKVSITGRSGYGSYSIGNSVNSFYGTDINTADYGVIITGGNAVFGASSAERLAKLNTELNLGLSAAELAALKPTRTTVNTGRFGVMWHGGGTVKVMDDTIFNTQLTTFLVKGASATISVDGSKGAQLNAKNGVLVQLIDNDDPGPITVNGTMVNKGVYHEPLGVATQIQGFDTSMAHSTDVVGNFSAISLHGDFYNAYRGGAKSGGAPGSTGPGGPGAGPGGPPGGVSTPAGKNLVLNFDSAHITGVISSSAAKHAKRTISAADYKLLGEVTNTPEPAVNNGAVVSLTKSVWTVTGTSYLTALVVGEGSSIVAPDGMRLTLTVDGKPRPIKAGAYKGQVELRVAKI